MPGIEPGAGAYQPGALTLHIHSTPTMFTVHVHCAHSIKFYIISHSTFPAFNLTSFYILSQHLVRMPGADLFS